MEEFTEEEIEFAKKTSIDLKRFGKKYTKDNMSVKEIKEQGIVDYRSLEEIREYYWGENDE